MNFIKTKKWTLETFMLEEEKDFKKDEKTEEVKNKMEEGEL